MSRALDSAWLGAGPERRQYPRRFLSGAAYLFLPDKPPFEVHTLDISTGGVGIVSPMALPYEQRAELRFTLTRESPGLDLVVAPVRVAYCVLSGRQHGFLVGLQFSKLPEATAAVIARYMAASTIPMGEGEPSSL
jgi:c-di-GMP-binding flagellar brake protein YcgR